MNWFGVTCELHGDWRNGIDGLGTLLANHLPVYRNLMTSDAARKKYPCRRLLSGTGIGRCSGPHAVARGLAHQGGLRLTCGANTLRVRFTIVAPEPTFTAHSQPTAF
jgi:hypothetical protein